MSNLQNRRAFLRFLASSPLLAPLWLPGCGARGSSSAAAGAADSTAAAKKLIASADQALDVFDFRAVAEQRLPPAHWGYMATGVDSDATLRANEAGYARLYLRPRRLVDVTKVDTKVQLFGREWPWPIVLSPVSGQLAFHPERELGSARAARAKDALQILSTVATSGVEEVA